VPEAHLLQQGRQGRALRGLGTAGDLHPRDAGRVQASPLSVMTAFDAIIIGAGQAGPPLAARLTGAGMKVAFVERGRFGGTCVNTGCTPTKTMVASASAAQLARRARRAGGRVGGAVTVDLARVKARADAIVARSRDGIEA